MTRLPATYASIQPPRPPRGLLLSLCLGRLDKLEALSRPKGSVSSVAIALVGRLGEKYSGQCPSLKLELTWNTALTIAKAMKPTKMNTAINTPLAITLVNTLS